MTSNHLIVGLGGTGGKVIREMRKIIERNGGAASSSTSDVHFDFVYLDTNSDELDKKEEWKVLGKVVELDRAQWKIYRAGEVRPMLADPGSFPGLKDWIEPRHVFDFVNANTAGAAQKRKLGRLVFAQNAPEIVKQLEQRITELEAHSGMRGAVIHLVCGLAGGTGSGSIVDAVAQIRHKYRNTDQYRILIYAMLPEINSKRVAEATGYSNYYANGYAALAELNAMAVGQYQPVNVLDGTRMKWEDHGTYFNGCYLVSNVNEHGKTFDVERDVPQMIAEFLYQKTLNKEWEGLGRAEKGENEIKNYEIEEIIGKARAKLFLTFGIKRVVVPEQEIKEYMAYGFAEQATRQLMYNNFRQGEGFADEAVAKDWGHEARKPETEQAMLLTDAHLTLEAGILEDDAKNLLWKPIRDYWKQIVTRLVPDISADKTLEQINWVPTLNTRMGKVFDETYRQLGGVRKFYEIKTKARLDMARHVVRHIEKDFFARWRTGEISLLQLRDFIDAVLARLDERQQNYNDKIGFASNDLQAIHQRIADLSQRFNNVGFLGKHLTDKRGALFADLATQHQDLYIVRTMLEGQKFAVNLIPFIREQLVSLRGSIDNLQQILSKVTERVNMERASRLKRDDKSDEKKIFDETAINNLLRAMYVDEAAQKDRAQRVRKAIILLAGTEVDSFEKLSKHASEGSLIGCLSSESAAIVENAHAELSKSLQPVLHVNIVERLQKEYDASPEKLKSFVSSLYDEAGSMLTFDQPECSRILKGNIAGTNKRIQTVGVFLPNCEIQRDFHRLLSTQFEQQKNPGSDTKIQAGRLTNEIIIMSVSSLMPARFVKDLHELKRHYDGLLGDENESFLLHGEGNGKKLPPLYARSDDEIQIQVRRRPILLTARLLGLVKERQNKTTGFSEWVFVHLVNGLPAAKVMQSKGKDWNDVINEEQPIDLQNTIEREVIRKIENDYKHLDRKRELLGEYQKVGMEVFMACGEDDQALEYRDYCEMHPMICRIIGLPIDNDN